MERGFLKPIFPFVFCQQELKLEMIPRICYPLFFPMNGIILIFCPDTTKTIKYPGFNLDIYLTF